MIFETFLLDRTVRTPTVRIMPTTNPSTAAVDTKFRNQLKFELLDMIRKRHPAIDRGLQFEGVNVETLDDKGIAIVLVLQEILQQNRDLSVVQWPGGIALVRTAQVDNLNADYKQVNENSNYIIRGGSDKASDLTDYVAVPTTKKE